MPCFPFSLSFWCLASLHAVTWLVWPDGDVKKRRLHPESADPNIWHVSRDSLCILRWHITVRSLSHARCSQYFWTIPRGRVQRKPRRDKRQTESKKKNEENINVPLRWGAKCFCSEKSPLWKLVKIDLTGHLGNFLCVFFHFLTIFSCLSKLLNTHSGRRHWIRHSQVLWEVIKVNKNNVLYKTTTPQVCQKKRKNIAH